MHASVTTYTLYNTIYIVYIYIQYNIFALIFDWECTIFDYLVGSPWKYIHLVKVLHKFLFSSILCMQNSIHYLFISTCNFLPRTFFLYFDQNFWCMFQVSDFDSLKLIFMEKKKFISNRFYSDRSELDLSDKPLELKDFHFSRKLWWKNYRNCCVAEKPIFSNLSKISIRNFDSTNWRREWRLC